MGACFSTPKPLRSGSSTGGVTVGAVTETRINSTRSDSYNKLILEHLEKNKENFEVIAKSISALSAVNNANTPAPLIRSSNLASNTTNASNLSNTNTLHESQCHCKCSCRASNENNEIKLNEKLQAHKLKLKKKHSAPALVKPNIRSINLVNKLDKKHKRYLIEVSDSYYSDFNYKSTSSQSSSDLTSSSEQRKALYRSFNKDLNKKMNKITKLKSKTQNEINCKNCENNHYYDEINHLSFLDCSTAAQKTSKRHKHQNNHLQNQHTKRAQVNRKNITTLLDSQPNHSYHNRLHCKQCLRTKNQETIKPVSKNKSYSTNTIKFKDIIDEDFYYDDDDLFLLNETQVGTANKEVKLNKSETINCGTFCNTNNNCNNNNTGNIDSNFVTKLNNNFHVDIENYENFNQVNDAELLLISNNNRNSQNIMKKTGITRKSDNNNNNNNNMLKNNELNETASSISSFFYTKKNSNNISNSDNLKQKLNNQIEHKKSSKYADYSIDKLSITFSSFSSPSSSSSSASLVGELNNSFSLTNSVKSVASSKTVTQHSEAKMESSNNTTGSETRIAETKSTSTDDQTQLSLVSDKLKLHTLIDSVGFLLFPSAKFVNLAIKELLKEYNLFDFLQHAFKSEFVSLFTNSNQLYLPPNERLIEKTITHLFSLVKTKTNSSKSDLNIRCFVRKLGAHYFRQLFAEYERSLVSIGGNMFSYFNNISSLHESLINHCEFGARFLYLNDKYTGFAPSFRAHLTSNQLVIHVYTVQEKKTQFLSNFYWGLIEESARLIWNLDVQCDRLKNLELDLNFAQFESTSLHSFILGYKVTLRNPVQLNNFTNSIELTNANELSLSADLFKSTFPFMIQLDRQLNITQIGDSLLRSLGQAILNGNGCQFLAYFTIEEPKLNDYSFDSLMLNQNMNFKLKMKSFENKNFQMKDMCLKGSIIYESETDCLLFLGSPVIQSLDELTDRGMYISDIPIHDAVRDIILVGEQTKAQEGLKFRMEKLKKSILKAHEDIDAEKRKNIELLNMIFPSDIAEKLWMGQKVNARNVENVTLLYSDIVGFTSICSSAEPIEIVKMLKNIYTEFDYFCGLVDVYKIETIGDAYIVAAGLHKSSKNHAQRAAWMSLLMLDIAAKNYTNKNEKIKMRIGLHTGDVLAGIVGIKQPRYCLFGNNCTIANKFESNSEENRIHVSPVTKALLDSTETFEMEPRSAEYLPENWKFSSKETEISWFLNGYKHKNVSKEKSCLDHVKAALNDLD